MGGMMPPKLCVSERRSSSWQETVVGRLLRGPQKFTLLSATFFCSFLGAANDRVQTPFLQVNGVRRRSALLSVNNISPSDKIGKIEWEFHSQNVTGLIIAEFKDGELERPDPGDQFGTRLEMVNGTTLRIQNLEKGDSGVYKARVRLLPAKSEEHTFHLTIYDPVPEPQILLLQETSDSSAECNVTLQCLVSEKGGLNVSWRIGDTLKPLEGGPDRYRLSSEGWHLHLSNRTDSNVTCLVSNPADQKSASFDLTGTCPPPGGKQRLWWLVFPIGIGIALLAGFWIWKKRKKQPSREDSAADSALEVNKAPEVQYMEVQKRRSPPEGENDQGFGRLSEKSLTAKTVYATVQATPRLPDQLKCIKKERKKVRGLAKHTVF